PFMIRRGDEWGFASAEFVQPGDHSIDDHLNEEPVESVVRIDAPARTVAIHIPGTTTLLAEGEWVHNDLPATAQSSGPGSSSGSGSASASASVSGSGSGSGLGSGSGSGSDKSSGSSSFSSSGSSSGSGSGSASSSDSGVTIPSGPVTHISGSDSNVEQ